MTKDVTWIDAPTILIAPLWAVTEHEPFGDATIHYDQGVTGYALCMLGGGHLRTAAADAVARIAGLAEVERAALIEASFLDDGTRRIAWQHPLTLEQATRVVIEMNRWAAARWRPLVEADAEEQRALAAGELEYD